MTFGGSRFASKRSFPAFRVRQNRDIRIACVVGQAFIRHPERIDLHLEPLLSARERGM